MKNVVEATNLTTAQLDWLRPRYLVESLGNYSGKEYHNITCYSSRDSSVDLDLLMDQLDDWKVVCRLV